MKDNAIIFSISNNKYELNYPYLSLLLLKSIELTNPKIDIYCALFTNLLPDFKLLKILYDKTNLIIDKRFNVDGNRNHFLRLYTCFYFSHICNLLNTYKQLIYVDIDAVFLNKLTYKLPKKSILIDTLPKKVIEEIDSEYVNKPFYFNWFDIITNDNKEIFLLDFNKSNVKQQYFDNVYNSKMKKIKQNFNAWFPLRPNLNTAIAFHYDGFNYMGYGHKLLETKYSDEFKPIIDKYFTFDRIIFNYWERKLK